jgi:hypothetical protein
MLAPMTHRDPRWHEFDSDEPEETDWGPWRAMPIDEAAKLLAPLDVPWWIAGGWAVDLFIGRAARRHSDVDVVVLRRDQRAVHRLLPGWDLQCADPPGTLRSWHPGERLERPIQDVWCRPSPPEPWAIQFMISDADRGDWLFKRDHRIRVPIEEVGFDGPFGLRVMRPEIALLCKGTGSQRRAKDDADFAAALVRMDGAARDWLRRSLASCDGSHPWLGSLQSDP